MKTSYLKIAVFSFGLFFTIASSAQVGEVNLKDIGGFGKFKKFEKKVFIAEFVVNYQVLYTATDKKSAGQFGVGGHYQGSAEASGAMGLKGISDELLKKMTNKLYKEYIDKLKSEGFTFVDPANANNSKAYEGLELIEGGEAFVQYPGTISVTPEGYSFYKTKRLKNKNGTVMFDNSPGISRDLDDAIVARVALNVQFAKPGQQFIKTGASVKIKSNLCVTDNMVTSQIAEGGKLIQFNENDVVSVASKVSFGVGKKMAAHEAAYNGIVKKQVTIDGVLDDTKVNAFARGSAATSSQTFGNYTTYFFDTKTDIVIEEVEVDLEKYEQYVGEALNKVLLGHTNLFLEEY
tara:strand:- start:3954 stop:4997 length:1044 start_codon:yes stop_codon:yes gene_type:complete